MPVEIYSIEHANARAEEIQEIEKSIAARKKNKMLFQILPFHKRRRTASFDERRIPKEYRRGPRTKRRRIKQTVKDQENLLKAHTWYAKRFSMYKKGEIAVPLQRHSKSESFIAKALKTRGVLSDISYNKVYVTEMVCPAGIIFDAFYNKAVIWSSEAESKIDAGQGTTAMQGRSIIITEDLQCIDVPADACKQISSLAVFEIFGTQELFSQTEFFNCDSVENLLEADTLAYICIRIPDKSYVLVGRKHCMELLQKSVVAGIVPCSIQELQRIATETEKVVYPYDIPQHVQGRAFLKYIHLLKEEEQKRKPKGKREVVFGPLYHRELKNQSMLLFVAPKGSFPRASPVVESNSVSDFEMNGSEEPIGVVGRSSFSFSKGKITGLLYIDENRQITNNLFVRNLKNKIFRRVEYTPVIKEMIL